MVRTASIPVMPGISISISTTSGRHSFTSSTQSSTWENEPTTSNSGTVWSSRVMLSLIFLLSSKIAMRRLIILVFQICFFFSGFPIPESGDRKDKRNLGSGSGCTGETQLTLHFPGAELHVLQAISSAVYIRGFISFRSC